MVLRSLGIMISLHILSSHDIHGCCTTIFCCGEVQKGDDQYDFARPTQPDVCEKGFSASFKLIPSYFIVFLFRFSSVDLRLLLPICPVVSKWYSLDRVKTGSGYQLQFKH